MTDERLYEGCSYAELIVRAIDRWPDRIALIDDGEELTYAALGRRAGAVAQVLRGLGLGSGDGIAQLSSNRVDAFVVMAAALAAGIRYTPLHPLGAAEDHAYILEDADIAALVVDAPAFVEPGAALQARVPGLRHLLTLGNGDRLFQ